MLAIKKTQTILNTLWKFKLAKVCVKILMILLIKNDDNLS